MNSSVFQENKKQNFQKTKSHYHEFLACSLIAYTKRDPVFAQHLKFLVKREYPEESADFDFTYRNTPYVLPRNRHAAVVRAEWLMNELSKETSHATLILLSWAQDAEHVVPKQIVVGIVGVAIPGPTLGLIKRRVSMTLVVKEGEKTEALSFTRRALEVSHEITLAELRRAKGDLYRLDPDFSDWFFGDKELTFYQATHKQFLDIISELKSLPVSFSSDSKNTLIALSPVINDSNLLSLHTLKKINTV